MFFFVAIYVRAASGFGLVLVSMLLLAGLPGIAASLPVSFGAVAEIHSIA